MKFQNNYDFVKNEEAILEYWEKEKTFEKLKEKNKDGKKFRFLDGPITANNRMHVGHAWGRTLKDTFIRYKGMNGYTSHYRNGFDGQGLWVEVEVEKELGFKTKSDIEKYGLDNFTRACVDRVKKFSGIITEQSKRLGQWMDWDNSYYTLKDENITSIWHFLKKCNEKNMIIQTYKPMPWCARCGTSLSEHEMTGSYHEVEHDVVFFKLPVIGKDYKALVWTTTPWTLVANVGLAVHPDFDYVVVQLPDEEDKLLMCKAVYERRFSEGEVVETVKGKDLEGLKFETCFPDLEPQKGVDHPIVCWDLVDDVEGSGIVHIAPGCGAEDFELGESLGMAKIVPIDENGVIYPEYGEYGNKKAKEVANEIFDGLKKQNKLFLVHKYKHSYPYCWRCKEDILFRLVKEWAIDVDVIRDDLIKNAKTVKYNPEHQGKRMLDWLQNMGNWNISRRRFYGLPLPFYVCECGHVEVIGSKEELREKAVDPAVVDGLPELHRPWIDEVKIKCPKCGKEVERIPQVGDVWLDAGIVPYSTLKYFEDKEYWKEYFPAEYVIEAHEQIRLWFYSMLFMSTVLENKAPYEFIKTSGMVVKEDGSKFSKSDSNNSFTFNDVVNTIGSDAMRYNYLGTNTTNDVRFGYKLGEEAQKKLLAFYNMVVFFNTYAEIDNVDLTGYEPKESELTQADKWLICLTDKLISNAKAAMEEYETKPLVDEFEKYVDQVSNFYIRINRRRFWKSEDDSDKKNAYYVLFNSIKKCTQLLAPLIPFMTEYIWQTIITKYDKSVEESVHLSSYPTLSEYKIDESILEDTFELRNLISMALRARNEKNIKVRQPLGKLYVSLNVDNEEYLNILKSEINVKEVETVDNFDNLKDEYLTLNFKNAGRVLKDKVNEVKDLLEKSKTDKELIDSVKSGNNITLGDFDLESELFNIDFKEKDTIKVITENNVSVALDVNITEELKNEGILRDIIRQCQVYRKEAGFNVEDRIIVFFESDNKEVLDILKSNNDLVCSELLAKVEELNKYDYENTFDSEDYKVTIKMKKN